MNGPACLIRAGTTTNMSNNVWTKIGSDIVGEAAGDRAHLRARALRANRVGTYRAPVTDAPAYRVDPAAPERERRLAARGPRGRRREPIEDRGELQRGERPIVQRAPRRPTAPARSRRARRGSPQSPHELLDCKY